MSWNLFQPRRSPSSLLNSKSLRYSPLVHSSSQLSSSSSSNQSKKPDEQTQDSISLGGTAPSYRCYIFLHSSVSPSSSSFSARLMTPLQRALQMKVLGWGGFVNWAFYHHDHSGDIDGRFVSVDPTSNTSDSVSIQHSATAFTMSGERIDIPSVSLDNLDEVNDYLRKRVEGSKVAGTPSRDGAQEPETHLLVCTHMTRDCRCGEKGGDFVKALREEVARRGQKSKSAKPSGVYDRIRIGETAHVGGHKYAANLLVYPQGDWFGNLTVQDVPTVLDYVYEMSTSSSSSSVSVPDMLSKSAMKDHWRGRMSLSKTEQLEFYNSM